MAKLSRTWFDILYIPIEAVILWYDNAIYSPVYSINYLSINRRPL